MLRSKRYLLPLAVMCVIVYCFNAVGDESPRGMFRIQVDGSELTEISPRADLCYGSVRYSHSGKKLAFDAWPSTSSYSRSHIYVMDEDGTSLKELMPGALPSWSMDDKQLVIRSDGSVNNSNIVVLNIDGSGVEHLPAIGNGPSWSPCGRYVAFRDSSSPRIAAFDASRGQSRTMIGAPHQPWWGGCWSPNGRYYCCPDTAGLGGLPDQLLVVEIDESMRAFNPRALVKGVEIGVNMAWSPDNSRILYFSRKNESDKFQLYTISVSGQDPPQLVPGQVTARGNTDSAWSPDGRRIVFVSQR